MVKIIINADDCGYNPEVNEAINHALSVGAISSTTIMANSQYLDEVHRMVERHPKASFGIHLNLTEGPSLTNSPVFRQRGITDENGCFIHGNSKRCPFPDDLLSKAILEEWDAQMDLLINKEHFAISHVDGHHHCHSWMGLEDILVSLMLKYGINKTRNTNYAPAQTVVDSIKKSFLCGLEPIGRRIPRLQRFVYYYTFNKVLIKAHIKTTKYFGAYEELFPILVNNKLKDSTIELMCHPGLKRYNDEYMAILKNVNEFDDSRLTLISYKEI